MPHCLIKRNTAQDLTGTRSSFREIAESARLIWQKVDHMIRQLKAEAYVDVYELTYVNYYISIISMAEVMYKLIAYHITTITQYHNFQLHHSTLIIRICTALFI